MFWIKEKTLVLKEKYLEKFKYLNKIFFGVFNGYSKISKIIFAYFPFQSILHLFLFNKKKLFWLRTGSTPPHPRLRTSPQLIVFSRLP